MQATTLAILVSWFNVASLSAGDDPLVQFLLNTKTKLTGMPMSYRVDSRQAVFPIGDDDESVAERIIVSNGLDVCMSSCRWSI